MRNKMATKNFYLTEMGFKMLGSADYPEYLMVQKDNVEIHFFLFKDLIVTENYGQIYLRTDDIDRLYQTILDKKISIHPSGQLQLKPWGQKEFSLLDPDSNLLTFGQKI